MSNNNTTKAPEDHPDITKWWITIKRQSWLSYLSLIVIAIGLFTLGIPEEAVTPLVIITLAFAAGSTVYSGGSVVIDAIKAWRSPTK